jgi:hypothetical protein
MRRCAKGRAKSLGITLPPSLHATANEVIE